MARNQGAVQEFNKEIEVSGPSSDADTIGGELATEKSLEQKREDARKNNPSGMSRPGTGSVDVEAAEAQFAELSRELSGLSRKESRQHSISLSRKSSCVNNADPEKDGGETTAEAFDLEAHLRGQQYAEQEAGLKTKRIGVIWENLTVSGIGGVKNYVKTFPDAFIDFFNVFGTVRNWFGTSRGREFDILKNFKGVAKPGEMVLVLGRPGSGCTTFLKVISNQRYGYTKVYGEILYGPFDAETFGKKYRGEALYNQEDDIHHPTLTVAQTLGFALDTKIPGKRPAMSKKAYREKVIETLLKMFNIEHTKDTIVGNAFLPGVSGGERKRVSIAEMMVTPATICAWDNTTRGLDASTALDYAKSLRIVTNIYKTTTFVSLYQASENIYSQFDKVLVIDEGHEVFFGNTKDARGYFEGIGFKEKPRQTTPDYLTGCTDEFERDYKDGYSPENSPSSPEDLEKAFNDSIYAQRLADEMNEYRQELVREKQAFDDFQAAVRDSKGKRTSSHSAYSIPFYMQVSVLMRRQYLIKWQDKFALTVSWITSLTIAIVLGTVWLNQPTTSAGAFTRGGLLFIALLFNAFQAFGELASTMVGRPIVNKHRAYTFHRPSALWIAQILVDMAFAAVQILVFSIIVYFMCHLVRDAGAFFTFYLIIIVGYLAMTLFFRTIGCLCPDFDYAIKFAAVIITLYVLTSGYLIQWQSEQAWLRWIFYINALALGFSALMMNEFKRLTMTCTRESLIPSGPGYTDMAHQACTLPGGAPGSNIIPGGNYIKVAFSYNPNNLWRNFGIIIALIVAFLISNVVLGEAIRWGAGGKTITFFQKENKKRKALNDELKRKYDIRRAKKVVHEGSDLDIASKAVLTWENLCYDVPVPGGTRRLLNDVFGYVKPGQLTALMGASGAGKTTLLDVLAARKNVGAISGSVLVDGVPPGPAFQRGTSYAEQLDILEPTQTVREALRFSADLRQSFETPIEQKYAYVEEVISLLEMEDIADAIIGSPEAGLAVEQRKRVTIGVELAAKPELLLFLDEPTSGLDSQSAFNIVRFLRKLAGAGQAILCTIHQPNSALFENFDRLLLLKHGGHCVYFGPIGDDANVLLDYFHRNGADCPPDANPAEWMLDAIGAGQAPRIGDRDWGDIWKTSPELANVKEEISRIKAERQREIGSQAKVQEIEYATPLMHQIRVVNWRTQLSFWRSPNYGFTRLFNHAVIALITGLAFIRLDNSRSSLQYRIFIIFQTTVMPALILAQVEPKYAMSRMIFYRESSAKMYSQFAFALSMVLAEIPYSILCAVAFFLPLIYIPGFQSAPSRAGYQFLVILVTEMFSVTLAQAVAAITPSPFISSLCNPFIIIVFALFCGVTIPRRQIPRFWRAWLYDLVPFTRLISGMVVTELHDRPVICKPIEYNIFTSPQGQTCGSYMSEFFAHGGPGYIINNATEFCQYCAYKVGDEFYKPLDMNFANRWRDLGILTAFIGSNLVILFLGSRYLNFARR